MKPFDESKYYLGTLCKRGHDYEGTGKSLRFISGHCTLCFYQRKRVYQRKKYKENPAKYIEEARNYRKQNPIKTKLKDKLQYQKRKEDSIWISYLKQYKRRPDVKMKNREIAAKYNRKIKKAEIIQNCITILNEEVQHEKHTNHRS